MLDIEDVLYKFNNEQCEKLQGKPKLFLFQVFLLTLKDLDANLGPDYGGYISLFTIRPWLPKTKRVIFRIFNQKQNVQWNMKQIYIRPAEGTKEIMGWPG